MAFEGLSSKLSSALSKLTSRGKLTEQAVKEGMRDVRMALLEADVNYLVVKDFCKKVTERCVGQQGLDSRSPAQQVRKIVSEEMTALMGSEHARLTWSSSVPTIYMLCGLQGAGKTTMAGKLANYLQKQGKKPLLAACDIYRPAAIKQLQVVGSQVNVPVYEHGTQDPVKTAQEAIDEKEAEKLVKRGPQELTLEDFLSQMQQMKKMGGLQSMLSMLPGANKLQDVEIDENAMKKPEAIIRSMTPRERRNPGILNASRRKRIAAGSGTTVQDVNALIRQFEQAKDMMKKMMGNKLMRRGKRRFSF